MALKSKKLARPTTKSPKEDADPLGLLPALHAKLKEAYYAQLRAFLAATSSSEESSRPRVGASSTRGRSREAPSASPSGSPSIPAMRRASLGWSANWRRRSPNSRMSICQTRRPTIRKECTSPAYSPESQFGWPGPSGGGESSAVADRFGRRR